MKVLFPFCREWLLDFPLKVLLLASSFHWFLFLFRQAVWILHTAQLFLLRKGKLGSTNLSETVLKDIPLLKVGKLLDGPGFEVF